ncbi:hypothetical protein BTN50_1133 [Candidatus Enterovibrio altilux]|uniref:Mobile element protein n=1 Tax=Candidatus Enterovibrio altilux TaxID=1927128 RepID=A0A291B9E7_9GAMM|nr:hypothetical protein BTN50_1133 [Candidatus Enterovibrio luxaltus]
MIYKQFYSSKLGSISPSVTLDAFNLAAMISCVFISTITCNLRQTFRFPLP